MRLVSVFFILLVSCGTRERHREEMLKLESENIFVKKVELDSVSLTKLAHLVANIKKKEYRSIVAIAPIDSTQEATLVEKVDGEVVREIILKNANYKEDIGEKESSSTIEGEMVMTLQGRHFSDVDSINSKTNLEKQKIDDLKRDNTLLGENVKLIVWLLILVTVAFIAWRFKLY